MKQMNEGVAVCSSGGFIGGHWVKYLLADGANIVKAQAGICRKVIEAKVPGVNRIGPQTRSFRYIDDCLWGTRAMLESGIREPINLGNTKLVKVNQSADMVERSAGVKLHRSYKLNAPQGVNGRNTDNSLIESDLN